MANELTEEWAYTAPAGEKLDRVCAEWSGHEVRRLDDGRLYVVASDGALDPMPAASTDWAAAGPLLEAMRGCVEWEDDDIGWCAYTLDDRACIEAIPAPWVCYAPAPQLAIARACALMVARGIPRKEAAGGE